MDHRVSSLSKDEQDHIVISLVRKISLLLQVIASDKNVPGIFVSRAAKLLIGTNNKDEQITWGDARKGPQRKVIYVLKNGVSFQISIPLLKVNGTNNCKRMFTANTIPYQR